MKGCTCSIDMDAMPSIEITGRRAACMNMEGILRVDEPEWFMITAGIIGIGSE